MKRTAIILMILSIAMKILGFFREIMLSYAYGASYISDAYLISLTIPGTIFAFIGAGIITGFIPMYNRIEKEEGLEAADNFTSYLINLVLVGCSAIILLILFSAEFFVKLFASGFQGKVLELAVIFTKVTSVEVLFIGAIFVLTGYLNIKNKFIVPTLVSIPFNICIIASILLSTKFGLVLLPLGSVLATVFQLAFLGVFIVKYGFKYKLILDMKNEKLKQMLFLSIPVIVGVSVNQINVLIDRTIASQITIGGISALNYSSRLSGFVEGIFISSIVTVLYPRISKLAAVNNIFEFKRTILESIKIINLLVLPITLGIMIFSEEIIIFLFGRGAFDQTAIILTSSALFYYSIGIIGFGLREILARAFYSLQDTRTPMVNASIGFFLNIALNIILSKYIGIGGLALATSISAIITAFMMFISLRKKIGPVGMRKVSISFFKILFASMLMGMLAKISFEYLTIAFSQNHSLLIAIGMGGFSYFAIIYFMKIEEIDIIVEAIKKRSRFSLERIQKKPSKDNKSE